MTLAETLHLGHLPHTVSTKHLTSDEEIPEGTNGAREKAPKSPENHESGEVSNSAGKNFVHPVKKFVRRRLPGLYIDPKNWTVPNVARDILYGIPIGISSVPQGIVFAELANLPVQYGLYSGFMGAFIYAIFGSFKQINVGPVAALAIMVGSATAGLTPLCQILFANVVCFLAGILSLFVGVFQLGFLVDLASPAPVVTAVLSAAGVIVMTSNVRFFLGLGDVKGHQVVQLTSGMVEAGLGRLNYNDIGMGAVSLVVLIFFQEAVKIKFEELMKPKLIGKAIASLVFFISLFRTPIWMASCGLVADYVNLNNGYKVFSTARRIENPGIPDFKVPAFSTTGMNVTMNGVLVTEPQKSFLDIITRHHSDLIVILVFCLVQHLSVTRRLAKGRRLDPDQELFTLGAIQVAGSFFQSMPVTAAFTRSGALMGSQVKTRLAALLTGAVVLLALNFFTPYMQYIPRPALGGIVFTGMFPLLQLEEVTQIWRCKRTEIIPFAATFLVCLTVSLKWGFIAGLAVTLLQVLIFGTKVELDVKKASLTDGRTVAIIKLDRTLHYHTSTKLKDSILDQALRAKKSTTDSILVLDCQHVADTDYTVVKSIWSALCAAKLINGAKKLKVDSRGDIQAVLVNVSDPLRAALSGISAGSDLEGGSAIFRSVDEWISTATNVAEDRNQLQKMVVHMPGFASSSLSQDGSASDQAK